MNHDYVFVQKKTFTHFFPNLYKIIRIYSYSMKNLFGGKTFGPTILVYKDGVVYWYASEKGLREVAKWSLKVAKEDPLFAGKVRKKFISFAPEILKFANKLKRAEFKKVTNTRLWNLMDEYLELYERVYAWGEPLVLSLNDMLGPELKKYLKTLVGGGQLNQYYNTLISCPEKSFVKEEEDALLRLALKIKKGQIKNRTEAVKKHADKYCWVPYDYGAYIWDEKYFNVVLDKMMLENKMEELLKKSKDYFGNLTARQNKIVNTVKMDKYHRSLFAAMRQANHLLDYKKQIFTILHWKAEAFYKEIAKRLGITKDLFQYYLPEELCEALVNNKPLPKKVLQDRYNNSVALCVNGKTWFTSLGKADEYIKQYLKKDDGGEKILNGIIASSGNYAGMVKVVNGAAELQKVQSGDILVASMTTPEYVPAMRCAGAIITDEGGVMCHAAIVSRELGIPCVVGTKNATKFLHDGDMVEVNANHNSVRIIKK